MITRIASFNVLRLKTPGMMDVILTQNAIDICGMQEVPGLKNLRKAFDQNNWMCLFDEGYSNYGTGLIFKKDKFNLVSQSTHILNPTPAKKTALEVVLIAKKTNQLFHIFVTHLDHKTEPQRLKEWDELQKVLPTDKPHIILGDFNSIRRSDYTDKEWQDITDSRLRSNWEPPQTQLINKIMECNYSDVLSDFNAVVPTCRFDTRVDYIFTYGIPGTPGEISSPIRSFVLNSENSSDHNIVVADFKNTQLN